MQRMISRDGRAARIRCKTIAYAIGRADDGDAIILTATPYLEANIVVNKSVSITGVDQITTIINGPLKGSVLIIPQGKSVQIMRVSIRQGQASGAHGDGIDSQE